MELKKSGTDIVTYQDNTEDMMANAFAGNILMPEQ